MRPGEFVGCNAIAPSEPRRANEVDTPLSRCSVAGAGRGLETASPDVLRDGSRVMVGRDPPYGAKQPHAGCFCGGAVESSDATRHRRLFFATDHRAVVGRDPPYGPRRRSGKRLHVGRVLTRHQTNAVAKGSGSKPRACVAPGKRSAPRNSPCRRVSRAPACGLSALPWLPDLSRDSEFSSLQEANRFVSERARFVSKANRFVLKRAQFLSKTNWFELKRGQFVSKTNQFVLE